MQHKQLIGLLITMLVFVGCGSNDTRPEKTDAEKAEIFRKLGARYLTLGKPEVAFDKLSQGLELDANNPQLNNVIAVTYERLGKDQLAREHFEKALELMPDDVDTLNNYGLYLCKRKQVELGLKYLQQAVDSPVNKARWQALTNFGRCSLTLGKNAKAEIYFKKSLLLQPEYAPALLEMSKIQYGKAKFMSARAYLERFGSATRGSMTAQALLLGVKIETALGADEMAEQYRNRLFKFHPDSKETEQLL